MSGKSRIIKASRSAITEGMLFIDGKPVSLKDYPFAYGIYDGDYRSFLLKFSRQSSKSTLASNFMFSESIAKPHFKTLYVAPSKEQTSKFSNTRLSKTLNYSPLIRKRFCGYEDIDNVLLKILTNGSEITLSYAQDDADRIRGTSADRLILDEVQDMDINTILPVVKECISNSNYGFETFCGTPKSVENGIEIQWQRSTQTEWIMKCEGCSKWSFIVDAKAVGLKGPICVKCGHLLNPRNGQWYDMNPGARLKGFHVAQLILPLNAENPARWDRIIDKVETYSSAKFNNEVLGVSDSVGARLLSKEDLDSLCDEKLRFEMPPLPTALVGCRLIGGGVDWSGGGGGPNAENAISRTVCWVYGLMADHRVKCLYYRVFPGRHPAEDVREVANVFKAYRCQMVVGDAGEGAVANALLKELLGEHVVYQVQYTSLAKQMSWNGKDRWVIDKTAFMDSYMLMLKRKGAVFGNIRQMQVAIADILNEFEETTMNGAGKRVWKHSPSLPDDSLHAGLFAWMAVRIAQGDLQLYKTDPAGSK